MTNTETAATDAAAKTKRTVLKRERVLVLPDSLTQEQLDALIGAVAAVKVKGLPTGIAKPQTAWVVVAAGEGSKTQAIEQHAGKPGTPDAKQGVYKAPNLSAWRGGEVYGAPPLPLVERRALDDDE